MPRPGAPFALGFAVLLAPAALASAATVRTPTLAAAVARAERIVVSEVVEVRCEEERVRGEVVPLTLVTVRVERTLKGTAARQIVLEFLGGRLEHDSLEVFDLPRFAVGDRDVLFIAASSRSVSPLVGVVHGRFRIDAARKAPRERVTGHDGSPLVEFGPRPVSLADFEMAVRQALSRPADLAAPGTDNQRVEGAGLAPRTVEGDHPRAARLAVAVDLGPAPALVDGCPDWSCALASRAPFVRGESPATLLVGAGDPAERVSVEWGRTLFGRAIDADVLALTYRRRNDAGTRTAVVLNDRLAWNSVGTPAGVQERPSSATGWIDLPGVVLRELALLVAPDDAAAWALPFGPTSRRARATASASGAASHPSRGVTAAGILELDTAGCDASGAFVDPRLLVFDSPDHSMMTGYQVGFFQPGAPSATQVVDLPLTAFLMRRVVDLPAWAALAMQSTLVADIRSAGLATPAGIVYTYRVRGVWYGGTTAWSDASQAFVRCPGS